MGFVEKSVCVIERNLRDEEKWIFQGPWGKATSTVKQVLRTEPQAMYSQRPGFDR